MEFWPQRIDASGGSDREYLTVETFSVLPTIERDAVPHKRNPNERRAMALLSREIGRSIRSWPGKEGVLQLMSRLPNIRTRLNESIELWGENEIGGEWGLIRPDAFFIEPSGRNLLNDWNPHCHHLCLVEVETTNPMAEDKVQRLGNCWDVFYCSDA